MFGTGFDIEPAGFNEHQAPDSVNPLHSCHMGPWVPQQRSTGELRLLRAHKYHPEYHLRGMTPVPLSCYANGCATINGFGQTSSQGG